MVKRSALLEIGGYGEDPAFRYSEAYDPFSRLAMRYRVANLPDRLVMWRRHRSATSIRHTQDQLRSGDVISFRNVLMLAEESPGDLADLRRHERYRHYLGFKAFAGMPPGQLPSLPGKQVVSGLDF